MNRYTVPLVLAGIWSFLCMVGPILVPGEHPVPTAAPVCFVLALVGLGIFQALDQILAAVRPLAELPAVPPSVPNRAVRAPVQPTGGR